MSSWFKSSKYSQLSGGEDSLKSPSGKNSPVSPTYSAVPTASSDREGGLALVYRFTPIQV